MTRAGRPSGTHTQAVRVLRLAIDLVEPRTLGSLARAYRVSERTIRRDLAALSQVYEIRCIADAGGAMAYEVGTIRRRDAERIWRVRYEDDAEARFAAWREDFADGSMVWHARADGWTGTSVGLTERGAVTAAAGWSSRGVVEILAPNEISREELRAAEREACAKLCDEVSAACDESRMSEAADRCAEKIRARGKDGTP